MKSIQVDSFQSNYKVLANYRNQYLLAESVMGNNPEPFAVWNIGNDGTPYGGTYVCSLEAAQQEFCERCFGSWFHKQLSPEEQVVGRKDYGTHWIGRYHGWLLAQQNEVDSDVRCFLPSDEWEGCDFPEWEDLAYTYEAEWNASSLEEAMEFIDNY